MKLLTLVMLSLLPVVCAAEAPASCSAPEHRQFDFWLGDWRVHAPGGAFAALNRITSEYGGCVIHERYANGRGFSGESLNVYDPTRKVWNQTWVDDSGVLLTLEGRWNGKSMVLEGVGPDASGAQAKQRITWTPHADGSLRQLWESADATGVWTVVFDGSYTRK